MDELSLKLKAQRRKISPDSSEDVSSSDNKSQHVSKPAPPPVATKPVKAKKKVPRPIKTELNEAKDSLPPASTPKPQPAPRVSMASKSSKGSTSSVSSLNLEDKPLDNKNISHGGSRKKPPVLDRTKKRRGSPPVAQRRINYENIQETEEGQMTFEDRRSYEDSGKSSTCSDEHMAEEHHVALESDEGCDVPPESPPPPPPERSR